MKKLLIAEDDINFSITLFNYIKKHNFNIEIVGISRDGEETIKKIFELKPDILLLDLKMPKRSGLDVISKIEENIQINNIDVIIISADITLINSTNMLKTNLIRHIFVKPFRIEDLSNIINKLSIDYKKCINKEVKTILKKFDFNISSKSYITLVRCIEIGVEHPSLLVNIEKMLYEEVAKTLNIENKNQMKWGIQKLIKSMNRYTNYDILNEFFPYNKDPSPKIFIKTISDIIRQKIKL